MPLSHFEEIGLLPFCGQMELKFVNFFYGTNSGRWKSRHPHNRLLFILESDGASTFGDDSCVRHAERGDWFLIPPFHEIRHYHNETMLHLSIHFTLSVCGGFNPMSKNNMIFSNRDLVIVDTVMAEIRKNDMLSLAVSAQVWCWTVLRRVLPEITGASISAIYANPVYAELFDFLWKHASAQTSVGDMATFAKMGKESFVKKFVRDAGISPGKFLDRILTAHAAKMLSENRCSVKEISATLNFCSEFYFSRFFRRQTDMSPRDFRKRFSSRPVS
ncbi:MAG TPA: hypothetical protein DCZ94_19010 [Lentisphaeria bacterium]|nr:MAG: hypothetical protein A2X48_08815 [Lentisphaerae bacterium GWF2_49_21]HBC89035.1 hypothetical protein [Lentisphaeria bacterium]